MTNQGKKDMDDFVSHVREFRSKETFLYWITLIFISVVLTFALWGVFFLALKTAGVIIVGTMLVCWFLNRTLTSWKTITK